MAKLAVVKTGGKQYLVSEGQELIVDHLKSKDNVEILLETFAIIDNDKKLVSLGSPTLKEKTQAKIIAQLKGEKLRVARFRAKVRYRKVRGFRAQLTKIKITKV